ncbi:MAG: MlaD family protein [Acidobacteriota bacterium]
MSSELKVGIFTAIALAILAYMIIVTGSCGDWLRKKEGQRVTALFDSIAGLEKKAAVRVAGVRVGEVSDIKLNPNGVAEVALVISENVYLHQDATAAVTSLGLMGEKYVEVFPGTGASPHVGDGAVIEGKEPLSIDQMGSQIVAISTDIRQLTSSLSTVFGSEEARGKMREIIGNFAEFSEQLRNMISGNREGLGRLLKDTSALPAEIRGDLERVSNKLDQLLTTLDSTVAENRGSLRSTTTDMAVVMRQLDETTQLLNAILKKVDSGDGTIGKLINEPTTHDKLNNVLDQMDRSLKDVSSAVGHLGMPKTKLGLRTEYLTDSDRAKTYLSLGVNPQGKRYFLLELVNDPTRTRKETTTRIVLNGEETVTTEKQKESFTVTAQGGMRFGQLGVRAGFTESTAGLGLDYSLGKDRLKLTLDGYDFGRDEQPRLKAGARLGIYKDFYLTVGGDDLLLSDRKQVYVGVGVGGK